MPKALSIRCNAPNVGIHDFIDSETASCGWDAIGDVSGYDANQIKTLLKNKYGYTGHKITSPLNTLCNIKSLEPGDIVVTPCGADVYIGKVTSKYYYVQGAKAHTAHRINVKWESSPVPRNNLPNSIYNALKHRTTTQVLYKCYDRLKEHLKEEPIVKFVASSESLFFSYAEDFTIKIEGLPPKMTERGVKELCNAILTYYGIQQ